MKKWIGLGILLLCSIRTPVFADGEVGEYVKFGDYRGADVRYYILGREDVNQDGVLDYLLISHQIPMYKPMDAETNAWKNTALRQWLNSSETEISWNGTPPETGKVSYYPYADEPGFLSDINMNAYERSLILPVTHKTAYPKRDGADGGTVAWIWNDGKNKDYRLALQNYDDAYYQITTDKMFIPSVKEAVEWNIPMLPTAAETAGTNLNGSQHSFLFRDATTSSTNKVRYFYEYNSISSVNVAGGTHGIRPMFFLDGNAVLCGNGTASSPYYVRGGRDGGGVVIREGEVKEQNGNRVYSLQLKNKTQADAKGQLIVAGYNPENRLEKLFRSEASLTSGRGKTVSLTVPLTEIQGLKTEVFYWDEQITPLEMHETNLTQQDNFIYKENLFMDNPEIRISHVGSYVIDNAFDSAKNTLFAIGALNQSEMIFSFQYPAKVTSVSLQSHRNGDWATIKTYELLVYDDENVKRAKSGEPKSIGRITLDNSSKMQTFDLSGIDGLENVTHLIFKPISIYQTSTKATWGGFEEIRIAGVQDKNEILVKKTAKPKLSDNQQLLQEMGIVLQEGEQSIATVTDVMQSLGFSFPDSSSSEIMSGNEFYRLLAETCGYDWKSFLELGIWSLLGDEGFSEKEFAIAMFEALMLPDKISQKTMLELCYASGKFSEAVYTHLLDKLDAYMPAKISEFEIPESMSEDTSFSFKRSENAKKIIPTNFSYNMPFHYLGGYLGTLPEEHPESKRTEFAKALKETGAKSLRFPGGLCSHQYFMEGEAYTQRLSRGVRKFGGLYDIYDSNNNTCIDFYDFLDFCTEQGIEPIYQVNTSFYVEPTEDKIYAITKNSYIASTDGTADADYYDRDRVEEAAEALGKQIDKMLSKGYRIKYWELGNEDFATINYLKTSIAEADNPATANYVAISSAFAKVIKEKIPDAVLIATGGFPKLKERYRDAGVYELMDYVSSHYPFANWTTPDSEDRNNLTRLLTSNEQAFVTNEEGTTSTDGKMLRCTTETSTWKFECWDGHAIQNTFAMALNTAHQWGELVFETGWEISTLHDLESPYFGFVQFNRKFNPETRYLTYRNAATRITQKDIPDDYCFFDQYLVNPAGRAVYLLSLHSGETVLKPEETSEYRLISAFASEKDGAVRLTVVNRTDTNREVSIAFENIRFPKQTLLGKILKSETPAAMVEREYTQKAYTMGINAGNQISFTAEPYSIYQFVLYE